MFDQGFKCIDHLLHKVAGCTRDLDYAGQSKLTELNELKQSLLHQTFSGHL
ncbi:hypothetical protein [Montanilutibacter psychrotolerans]|uniref:hypothetical protein n=1 Tax=Montanilutibacter psychrotolerans TaxID=1327343 RepID=UPI0016811453|nr:hypothetical protein [Lysobacter psychrotolerans]